MVAYCPHCGNQVWQITLDDPRVIADRCPECKRTISANTQSNYETDPDEIDAYLASHFRELDIPHTRLDLTAWPDDFSAYFPKVKSKTPNEPAPDWEMELFGGDQADTSTEKEVQTEPEFSNREREEAHRRMLRSHGLSMGVDSQGLRITSPSSRYKRSSSELSPYDIVRLASELEGGVVSLEERVQCPHCHAIVLPKDTICQWCSTPLD